MDTKLLIRGRLLYVCLAFTILVALLGAGVGTVQAQSVFLAADHHTRQFDAWNVNPDGTVIKQGTYPLSFASDPAGVAIDEDSNHIFITSEFSSGVEIVDGFTMSSRGRSTGPSDLAGIDVDDFNNVVYTVGRQSNQLYVYDWDDTTYQLNQRPGTITLPNLSQAFGLALDETRNTLWVADAAAGVVRAYDTNTWAEDISRSFQPIHNPVDVTVDRIRNLVYTVSIIGGAYVPPNTGSTWLSQYDVANTTENTVNMGQAGVGVAVEETRGYIYVTRGAATAGDDLQVWDTSLGLIQDTPRIGNPAGIAIANFTPQGSLDLAKNDVVTAAGVHIGSYHTYTINCDNPTTNNVDATNIQIVDTLPSELDFVSATLGGTYNAGAHTVTWDVGSLAPGEAMPEVELRVRINNTATPESTLYDYATATWDVNGVTQPPNTAPNTDPVTGDPGTYVEPSVFVNVDIKPGGWPNSLNVKSKGVLPVAVLGTEDFDVTTIDPTTILMSGEGVEGTISPLRWSYEDVGTPYEGDGSYGGHDLNGDGFMDLSLKFDTEEAVAVILGLIELEGELTMLDLTGSLIEGVPIVGADWLRILHRGDVNGDNYVNGLDLSTIITNWGMTGATREQGDLNADGTVSGLDYSEVVGHWGSAAPEPPAGIPEPATLGLLLAGGLVLLRRRRM